MRIDALNKVSQLYKASNVKNTSKSNGTSFSDTLEISQSGKDYQLAKQIIARTPDIREAKVNDIKQRMEAGAYHVNTQDVVNKLVEEYFSDTI